MTESCDVLGVSRSGYYSWKQAVPNAYQQQDEELGPRVADIFFQHRRRYGARRTAAKLTDQGVSCSRSKARKIMDQMGLMAIKPNLRTVNFSRRRLSSPFSAAQIAWIATTAIVGAAFAPAARRPFSWSRVWIRFQMSSIRKFRGRHSWESPISATLAVSRKYYFGPIEFE